MSRPAPALADATPEESFLAAIANPWRRELVAFCAEPRTKQGVFREFLCASKKQRYAGLNGLVETGWLRESAEMYRLNAAAPVLLSQLIGVTVGQSPRPYEDDEACDAAVAALRRTSCRRIVSYLESGPASFGTLREFAGVPHPDFVAACKALTAAYAVRDEKPLYVLTGAGFPALEGWLDRLSVGSRAAA